MNLLLYLRAHYKKNLMERKMLKALMAVGQIHQVTQKGIREIRRVN